MIKFSILTDKKGKSYELILDIIDCLIKIVYYAPIKMTINTLNLKKVIINVVVKNHSLLNSIITD